MKDVLTDKPGMFRELIKHSQNYHIKQWDAQDLKNHDYIWEINLSERAETEKH